MIARSLSGQVVRYVYLSPRLLTAQVYASGTVLAVNSGTQLVIGPIDSSMSGFYLTSFTGYIDAPGVTGLTRMSLRDLQKGKRQMFSTNPSIDSAKNSTATAATPYVISGTNKDIGAGDVLSFDILQIQTGTPPKGLRIVLRFEKP